MTTARASRPNLALKGGHEPAFYRRRKKRSPDLLGQILVRQGALAPRLLRKALRLQDERGGQLGRILVRAGGCTESAVASAMREQARLRAERPEVNTSTAAREAPAIAGLRVAASPRLTATALVATDALALAACALPSLHLLGPAVGVALVALASHGLYGSIAQSPPDELRNATKGITFAFVCTAAIALFRGEHHPWAYAAIAASWACALFLVPVARAIVRAKCAHRPWWGTPVVVLGAGKTGRLVVRTLKANPRCGLKPVVMLDDDRAKQGTLHARVKDESMEVRSVSLPTTELLSPSIRMQSGDLLSESMRAAAADLVVRPTAEDQSAVRESMRKIASDLVVRPAPEDESAVRERSRGMFAEVEGVPVVGDLALAPMLADRLRIPYAIIAMPRVGSEKLTSLVEGVGGAFSHLLVIPDLFGLASLGVPAKEIDGILGLEVRQQLLLPGPCAAKRAMDLVLTVLGGIFVLPIIAAMALLIRLDSKGAAFYPQDRLGRDQKRFRAFKFRTMHGDGEARLRAVLDADPKARAEYEEFHKLTNDPRVTRIGRVLRKYSLDELPQLWNVLRGEMSLVGPRPYLERELPDMDRREKVILRALPGMTGLWQVGDRNATNFDARVRTDVHYVRNWSPWLDVWVLARTFEVVVRGTGS